MSGLIIMVCYNWPAWFQLVVPGHVAVSPSINGEALRVPCALLIGFLVSKPR
jgi:hypothetical protein